METCYIGRYSISVPSLMSKKIHLSKLRHVELNEVLWPKDLAQEEARKSEWEQFVTKAKKTTIPEGASSVVIRAGNFPKIGKWSKGMFYYDGNYTKDIGLWSLLIDEGVIGLWLKSDPVLVEKELATPKTVPNFENIAIAYESLDLKKLRGRQPCDRFYLQHGAINLPYAEQEETTARFEGGPLALTLLIEMEMNFRHHVETMGLIEGTRAMLAAALVTPGGGLSKIRLRKREVAGMPGEESVLRVTEGDRKDLVFTWQFNGKYDSGEYPTTKIEMESPDGNLQEKLEIWDAILDSMKPVFERKQ